MNKSEAIRDYFGKHPSAGLTEIAKALSAQGVAVTASHVQQALRGLRGAAPATPAAKAAQAKPAAAKPAPAKSTGVVSRRPRAATLLKREAAAPTPAPAVSRPTRPTRAAAAPRAAAPRLVQKSSGNVVEVIELARKFREAAGSTTDAVKILNSLA